jgi:F420H(2)-dependent quinone reductase
MSWVEPNAGTAHALAAFKTTGLERPNPWTLNLRAQPHARVQVGRDMFDVTAHEASADELGRYWPNLTTIWPAYQSFYDSGGARSVFVLERAPQAS